MQGELKNRGIRIEEELGRLEDNEKAFLVDIIRALREIHYGYVQITVQDSQVIQIDKMEKLRLDKNSEFHGGGGNRQKK